MVRPCCPRYVAHIPAVRAFKPAGVPLHSLQSVTLTLDDVEALRLADLEGRYQEEAAEKMKISRPTFARVVESARRKVADALVHGKAILLEGGPILTKGQVAVPNRDGTGPGGRMIGQGRGPCGCSQRRGWAHVHQRARPGFAGRDKRPSSPEETDETATTGNWSKREKQTA